MAHSFFFSYRDMEWLRRELTRLNRHENNMSFSQFVDATHNFDFDVLNLANFQILLTGKLESGVKCGWILRFIGCSSSNIFDGEIALAVEECLFEEVPPLVSMCSIYKTLTLTHFRRVAFPIHDTMTFENTSFLILGDQQRITRLAPILAFLKLPQIHTEDIPFFISPQSRDDKKRSYKKTYNSGSRKSLKPVHKKVDKLILTYQKSICDVEKSITMLQTDLNKILEDRLRAIRMAKQRELERERRLEEANISFEDILHLLPDGFLEDVNNDFSTEAEANSTLLNSPSRKTTLSTDPPDIFF